MHHPTFLSAAALALAATSACARTSTTDARVVAPDEGAGALRVDRSPTGGIVYRYRRGARFAKLVDEHGRVPSLAPPPALAAEESAARAEHDRIRLPVDWREGQTQGAPPPKIEGATTSQNVEELRALGKPSRFVGVLAAVTGASLLTAGAVDGVGRLDDPPSATRTGLFAVDGTFAALGAVIVTTGAWYLLAPEEQSFVYRTSE